MPVFVEQKGDKVSDTTSLSQLEQAVVKSFEQYMGLILQDAWYVTINFIPESPDEEADDDTIVKTLMETSAEPSYRTAQITVYTNEVAKKAEFINHMARHEVLHILTWQFFSIATTLAHKHAGKALKELEESMVDRLEHMPLFDLLAKHLSKPKKK